MRNKLTYSNYYKISNDASIVKISKLTDSGIKHALRLRYSKVGVDIGDISHTRYCVFCGKVNNTWFFNYTLKGKTIDINSFGYKKDINYCFLPNNVCAGKKLNANSREFVTKVYNLTQEDATKFIHSRNSTDFYRTNHTDDESYKKTQSNRLANKSEDEVNNIIFKANYARSLECYKERFGDINGKLKWDFIQQQKAITLDNMIRVHGGMGEQKYNRWKYLVSPSLDRAIEKYGNELGLQKARERMLKLNSEKNGSQYAVVTVEDGHILRSNLERKFYQLLKQHNLINVLTDQFYSDSIKRSDFYFPDISLHVEIAGFSKQDVVYWERLQYKIDMFSPLVITKTDLNNDKKIEIILKNIMMQHNLKEIHGV